MHDLERRVLDRVLTFCLNRQLIGAYHFEDDSVQIIVESEFRSLTVHQALRYLLALLEEAGMADEFYGTVSK